MRLIVQEHPFGKVSVAYMRVEDRKTNEDLLVSLDAYCELMLSAKARGLYHAGILDLNATEALSAHQRKLQADWNQQNEPLFREVCLGMAFVTQSLEMRGVVTAVAWLAKPPTTRAMFNTLEQALSWIFERCQQHGHVPSDADRRQCLDKFSRLVAGAHGSGTSMAGERLETQVRHKS